LEQVIARRKRSGRRAILGQQEKDLIRDMVKDQYLKCIRTSADDIREFVRRTFFVDISRSYRYVTRLKKVRGPSRMITLDIDIDIEI
jgi:hypothetical protein